MKEMGLRQVGDWLNWADEQPEAQAEAQAV